MKFNLALLFLSILFLASCSNQSVKVGEVKTIVLQETEDVLPISSFVKSVEYLELNFPNKDIGNGEIEWVKKFGNDLIIKYAKSGESKLFLFSANGEFKNEFKSISNPRDVIEFKDDFAIWDENGIQIVSRQDQILQKTIKNTSLGNRFFYSKNNFYLFHEMSFPGYLSSYNVSGKQGKVFKPNTLKTQLLDYSEISELTNGVYHLFTPLNDTVFAFSGNKLFPKYLFKGDIYPTYSQILVNSGEKNDLETLKYLNNNRHIVIKKYVENENYLFIVFWFGSTTKSVLIKKSTWESLYFERAINDIDGGLWGMPSFLSDDNVLYIPLNPYRINSHKVLNKSNNGFEKQRENFLENNKRVIMMCKLK